jgi:hypothetical protein
MVWLDTQLREALRDLVAGERPSDHAREALLHECARYRQSDRAESGVTGNTAAGVRPVTIETCALYPGQIV